MEKSKLNLEDLIPDKSSFKLAQFPDIEFKLEPCTGGKIIEMTRKLGQQVEVMLGNPSVENLSKLAIMLMDYESASHFKKQDVKIIDVLTGDEIVEQIGGYKLLSHCIRGIKEQYLIYSAILMSMGYQKEKADKIISELVDGMNKAVNNEIDKDADLKKKKKENLKQ